MSTIEEHSRCVCTDEQQQHAPLDEQLVTECKQGSELSHERVFWNFSSVDAAVGGGGAVGVAKYDAVGIRNGVAKGDVVGVWTKVLLCGDADRAKCTLGCRSRTAHPQDDFNLSEC
jgi:hypothetical protein